MTHCVFISSTGHDLNEYRQAAIDTCNALGLIPIAMEFFEAMGKGATAGSKSNLDVADVYVGIFAHRYGYIEDGYDRSITEIEFEHAGERKLERLCFVVDPDLPWPPAAIDHANHLRLEAFKGRIGKLIRAQFTNINDFKYKLLHALQEWKAKAEPQAASKLLIPHQIPRPPSDFTGRGGEVDELISKHKPRLSHLWHSGHRR